MAYDAASLPALAAVVRVLLKPAGTASVAVIAATKRSESTFNTLLAALTAEGLSWELLTIPPSAWQEALGWLGCAHDRDSFLAAEDSCRASDERSNAVSILRICATPTQED